MNPYTLLGSGIGTPEAVSLSERLAAWHDAMIAHERQLQTTRAAARCDEECPHAAARQLWNEAVETFGLRANDLAFLQARGAAGRRHRKARG